MNLNKAFIVGNLTRDPELRTLPSGMSVCSFGVATNRTWKDTKGQKQDDVQFHNVVVFGKQAESVNQYLTKGNLALIEGRIQTRSWDDSKGVKQYRTEIVAERIQFGPKSATSAPKAREEKELPEINVDEDIDPSELPF